MYKTYMFY